jgi:hypothetical protein
MHENVWTFGYLAEVRVETKFGQKTACPDRSTFFPNLDKESQDSTFGTDLEGIWNIQIFGYLNI